jgi:hypothetical protein
VKYINEFISASTAGVVNVRIGFIPDFVIFIQAHGGTNPNVYLWANPKYKGSGDTAGWPVALSLLITGSSGVITRDTTGITVFDGGTTIASDETDNSDPKHIDHYGNPAKAGDVTQPGVSIPADHQTNSGRNLLIAIKEDGSIYKN